VTEEGLGRDVEEGFVKLGWNRERTVVMAHHREPDQRPATGSARRINLGDMRRARELSLRQETEKKSESEIQQLVDCARLMEERIGARFYGARAGDEIASTCELYSDGATAQIEAVITFEQHRNKGLARAVVMAALNDAVAERHDLVFLVADDDDWPQELYRKVGFEAIGRPFCDFILSPH
jgi:predicted GNAT family acetyltransferase